MEERRRFVRVPFQTHLSYKVIPSPQVKSYSAKDISRGGLRFLLHEPVAKGSHLRVRLTLPAVLFSFEALVRIEWITERPLSSGGGFEVGVSFIDIPGDAVAHLLQYVESFAGPRDL